jgi:type VI secretion system Hcp family effector
MSRHFRVLISSLVLFLSPAAFSAATAIMTITGAIQGEIPGSCEMYGFEDTIEVYAYTFNIAARPDEHCRPTGELQNYPLSVVKGIDRATPALLRALNTNEALQVRIDFFKTDHSGSLINHYSIALKNARISGISQEQLNNRNTDNFAIVVLEKIGLTYGEMVEIWHLNKDEAAIVWKAECTEPLIGDLNFDGVVNLKDFILMADDWLLTVR